MPGLQGLDLWCFILCVNLIGWRFQVVGKTLFLGMSLRVFPEDINIWIDGPSAWASTLIFSTLCSPTNEFYQENF